MRSIVVAALLLLGALTAFADTTVPGQTIATNTTWTLAGSPYIVTGQVLVRGTAAPVLTIEPGVVVKFNNGTEIMVNSGSAGSLYAVGTAAAPITFSSASSTSPSSWAGLFLGNASTSAVSQVAYATIEYAGRGYDNRGAIHVDWSSPILDHVTLRNSFAGLTLWGGAPTVSNCTMSGNSGDGVRIDNNASPTITNAAISSNGSYGIDVISGTPSIATTTLTGNGDYAIAATPANVQLNDMTSVTASGQPSGKDAILMRAGTIAANRTWKTSSLPYVVSGTISVQGAANPLLTIEAGTTVKLLTQSELIVNNSSPGALSAIGTATQPIVFTSATGTAKGSWDFLLLGGNGPSASQVSYATIENGGSSTYGYGGVQVTGGSPVFDHVTIRNNLVGGVKVSAGSPAFTNCTFDGNSNNGFDASAGSPTLTNCTFTNNASYAVGIDTAVQLAGMSGLIASGNGSGDAILLRAGTMNASRTWHTAAIPYIVNGSLRVADPSAPVLTIEPGVTVKFTSSSTLLANDTNLGSINATGTAAQPILFTSNGTATAGFWQGIVLGARNGTPSSFAYCTIEYAGYSAAAHGGIHVDGNAPAFDHLILRNNSVAGLSAAGGTPSLSNSSFSGNPAGIATSGTATVDARRSYWNSSTGPSGSGFGSGQSVTAVVKFEPWLMSAPTAPQYFSSATVINRVFKPSLPSTSQLIFATPLTGTWTATIFDGAHNPLRTFTGSTTTGTFAWDGKNDAAVQQMDGTYTYELAATSNANDVAAALNGRIVIDSARALTITGLTAPAFFSPNGDGIQETLTVTSTSNYDDTTWTVAVKNAVGTAIRNVTLTGTVLAFAWDGRDDGGVLQPDGLYSYDVTASEGASSLPGSASSTLDATPPVAQITSPSASTLSDVYQNGSPDPAIIGSATDANLASWTLDYGSGASPSSWSTLLTGTSAVSNAQFTTWATLGLTNGSYTLRLQVADKAGTLTTVTRQLTLSNFKLTPSAYQLNATAGGTITYTSIVPFTLTETIVIRNQAGQAIRTFPAVTRNAGTYTDVWNGRNDANAIPADGPYFVVANLDDGTHSATFDLTNKFLQGIDFYYPSRSTTFDPYNNQPLSLTYTFGLPGRVTIVFSNKSEAQPCGLMDYCWKRDEYQPSGTATVAWNGLDDTGRLRSDLSKVSVTSSRNNFPQNAAVLYGSKPVLTAVTTTPSMFSPAVGPQTIAFDLATYQSQSSSAQLTFRNVSSGSTLRTITLANQSAGHITVSWDGRADNGMWVAAGNYMVTIAITDPIGNVIAGQLAIVVQY
jgi:parallel beta-helix repeat protein